MTGSYLVRLLTAAFVSYLFACAMLAQQAPTPEPAAAPVPALADASARPSQTPPGQPRVSCKNNQLRINAENSTLRSVLVALQSCIGVQIEIPASLREERSFIQLGPGPTREVLQDLLSSTDLDYALQPSDTDPERINAILLMTRPSEKAAAKDGVATDASGGAPMSAARRAWLESSHNAARQLSSSPAEENSQAQEASPASPRVLEKTEEEPVRAASAKEDVETNSASEVNETAKASEIPKADPKANLAEDSSAAPVVAPNADPAAPPTAGATDPADGSHASPEDKQLQNKINDMQQLFEERKKLIANPGDNSTSPAPPPSQATFP